MKKMKTTASTQEANI